jgi:hypothetical protein
MSLRQAGKLNKIYLACSSRLNAVVSANKKIMLNKTIKNMFKQDNEYKITIASERRPGESESAQDKRVEEMAKRFAQEPTKLDKKKLDAFLDIAMTAIEDWKKECVSQGQYPTCISSFSCVDRQTKDRFQGKYMIFGEPSEVMDLLKQANKKING